MNDDIEYEIDIPSMRGKVRKGRWFSHEALRAWGEAIIRATLTELRTEGIHIGAGAEEWIDYDAIFAAAEQEVPS